MQIHTGAMVPIDTTHDDETALRLAALELGAEVEDVVLVRGELRAVQQVGERVRLGAAEQERRRQRRKRQQASRRANR